MSILTDTVSFLRALRGEDGELRSTNAKRIVKNVRRRIITAGEAADEFFGRESEDILFTRVMLTLSDQKKGGAVHRILNAVCVPTISVPRAMEDLIVCTGRYRD